MIERKLKIGNGLEDSIFLFGARQTVKSTFLRVKFPDSIFPVNNTYKVTFR